MCDRVTLLYSRKLTEHYKPAMTEKIKVTSKKKKKKKERKEKPRTRHLSLNWALKLQPSASRVCIQVRNPRGTSVQPTVLLKVLLVESLHVYLSH